MLIFIGTVLNAPVGFYFTIGFADIFGVDVGTAARTPIGAIIGLAMNVHVVAFALFYVIVAPIVWAQGAFMLAVKASLKKQLNYNAPFFSHHIANACVSLEKKMGLADLDNSTGNTAKIRNALLNESIIKKSPWLIRIMYKRIFQGDLIQRLYEDIAGAYTARPSEESEILPYYQEKAAHFIENVEFNGLWSYMAKGFLINMAFHVGMFVVLVLCKL